MRAHPLALIRRWTIAAAVLAVAAACAPGTTTDTGRLCTPGTDGEIEFRQTGNTGSLHITTAEDGTVTWRCVVGATPPTTTTTTAPGTTTTTTTPGTTTTTTTVPGTTTTTSTIPGTTTTTTTVPGTTTTTTVPGTTTTTEAPGPNVWGISAIPHRGANGQDFQITCPPNGTEYAIWGTGTYTDDSSICTAAVHSGLITFAAGGTVTYRIAPGQDSYTGTTAHGVTSRNWGSWVGSFTFPS